MEIAAPIHEVGTQIEQLQKQEMDLQARETRLLRAVDDGQSRWSSFNQRLDGLEQGLLPDPSLISLSASTENVREFLVLE